MEPITIATSLVALLIPFAKKATEEFAGEAGKEVYEMAKSLLARLKSRWEKDPDAKDTLSRFKNNPEQYQSRLENVLKEKIEKEPDLASELSQLIEKIKKTGPTIRVIQKMRKAEKVVGVEAKVMTRGAVTVVQETKEAKDLKGAKIDRIG